MSMPLGMYEPGDTVWHRLGAGLKLLGLLVVSTLVVVVRGPWSSVALVAVAVGICLWTGMNLRAVFRSVRILLLMLAALMAWHAWQNGWARAVEAVGDLLGLVLLATVVTVTTPIDDILDVLVRLLGPFRRVGVNPERVALAFSLTIRAIPTTLEVARQTRDAAAARGLERDPRARLVPLVIRVVANARATGEALEARGIGDD
ncbi:MAG: energy-coupling factor transporter transmembrane component T family protein [Nocardioides sp.]|uniref:energy-coupling factor transporter transmembrane component T family protein n=1 Tax=Nocardioides sp. TaxID=35761 RepID=UPI003F11630E